MQAQDDHYYELRLYEMVRGRLWNNHDLMGRRVAPLFARHGLAPLSMWTSYSGPISPSYGYLLRWPSLDDRMQSWGRFYSDPDWIKAMNDSYTGEQRIERANISFMRASPAWEPFWHEGTEPVKGVYELRIYTSTDRREAAESLLAELESSQSQGGRVLGVFDTIIGAPTPRSVAFIAWPNEEEWRSRAVGVGCDPSRASMSCDSFLLHPTNYGMARENFASHPVPSLR